MSIEAIRGVSAQTAADAARALVNQANNMAAAEKTSIESEKAREPESVSERSDITDNIIDAEA